ncbi:MAG: hypothetical protein ACOX6T_00540 [Myxococcales bacterium]
MKIGLVADSQGDVDALEHACDLLIDEKGAERIFFLGGRWADVDELFQRKREKKRGRSEYSDADFLADVASFIAKSAAAEQGGVAYKLQKDEIEAYIARFARVPDRASFQYRDPAIPRILPELVADRIACLVHDKADLQRDNVETSVFFFHGNSAEPNVVQIGLRFFVTPGSLASVQRPSFALLTGEGASLELVAFSLDGRELRRFAMSLATRRKMSLR